MSTTNRIPTSWLSSLLVTLTTDYGWQSEGLAVMKGIILSQVPEARVVDICHSVVPFSVLNGARQLEAVSYMPPAIHLAVIDPEVGTGRHAVGLLTGDGHLLIGPDNGVLLNAAHLLGGPSRVWILRLRRSGGGVVFDGRDVFAYTAGQLLSCKLSLDDVGTEMSVEDLVPSPLVDKDFTGYECSATVVHINRFGTLILNILSSTLDQYDGLGVRVSHDDRNLYARFASAFARVPPGEALICDDGYGRYCVAVNNGDAGSHLGAEVGSVVNLHRERNSP